GRSRRTERCGDLAGGTGHGAGGRDRAGVGQLGADRSGAAVTISVVGLGKIGLPLAVQFAGRGHRVLGVDIDERVVLAVRAARPPFPGEDGLAERLAEVVESGLLEVTTDTAAAV